MKERIENMYYICMLVIYAEREIQELSRLDEYVILLNRMI